MTELAALIKLCDDQSSAVAAKIARRLREIVDNAPETEIWPLIESQKLEVSASQRAALTEIFAAAPATATVSSAASTRNASDAARSNFAALFAGVADESEPAEQSRAEQLRAEQLRAAWRKLRFENDEISRLESALLALCDWQSGTGTGARGRDLLDELALEFGDFELSPRAEIGIERGAWNEAGALAYFLFDFKHLRGAAAENYYQPEGSNLTRALESGRGLPITLTCIFILVGRRVGLSIQGCSFPGHFLARDGQSRRVFDPFNGGKALSAREVGALQRAAPDEMSAPASTNEIIARVLRNLSVAYYQSGEGEKSAFMLELLRALEA